MKWNVEHLTQQKTNECLITPGCFKGFDRRIFILLILFSEIFLPCSHRIQWEPCTAGLETHCRQPEGRWKMWEHSLKRNFHALYLASVKMNPCFSNRARTDLIQLILSRQQTTTWSQLRGTCRSGRVVSSLLHHTQKHTNLPARSFLMG